MAWTGPNPLTTIKAKGAAAADSRRHQDYGARTMIAAASHLFLGFEWLSWQGFLAGRIQKFLYGVTRASSTRQFITFCIEGG